MSAFTVEVRPMSDHERRIARIVDQFSTEGKLRDSAIDRLIAKVDFAMSRPESEFLLNYMRWRIDHPDSI
jgi:hypothetical protein